MSKARRSDHHYHPDSPPDPSPDPPASFPSTNQRTSESTTKTVSIAITIGTFDGVHLGHQALVQRARTIVGSDGHVVAIAFGVHPMACLRPDQVPARLDSIEQRAEQLRAAGADEVALLQPSPELLGQEPEAFIGAIVDRHRPAAIVTGDDFHFGRGRRGSVATLRGLGVTMGFETVVVPPIEIALVDQSVVAVRSTLIRWLLRHGRIADATRCLGREFELRAQVVPGDRRGRTIGYPTANLDLADHGAGPRLVPGAGVYAGSATLPDGTERLAAISVGTKPTFGESPSTCEAYLLDHEAPVEEYGWTIRLRFAQRLRDQLRFAGLEPLLAQMDRDIDETRRVGAESATVTAA